MGRDIWLVAAFAALGAALAGVGVVAYQRVLPTDRLPAGATIEDRVQPPDAEIGEWLERERERLLEREVFLALPEDLLPVTLGQLGVELDVGETREHALAEATSGGLAGRWRRARQARRGELSLPAVWTLDEQRAKERLFKLVSLVHRDPVDARQDLKLHQNVPDQPGRELDVDATLEAIRRAPREETAIIPLVTSPIPAQVTVDMLGTIDVSKVLAAFETDFRRKAGARTINIAVAARYLDGSVIAPGQTLSFNKVVGPREYSRGFVDAPVIVEDEMERGVGGGVCQVASTLHAAAVYGLMDIVERRSHSRPSGYAPLGLDAVVIWNEQDLKIRNPYDRPILIHAFLPSEYVVRVELLGVDPAGKVEHQYAVTEKYDFVRRVRTKPELEAGREKRHQKGIPGYDVVSIVKVEYPDGRSAVRRYKSKYWPVPEVYWVAPGYDLAALPELPEGAAGVEFLGEGGVTGPGDDHAAGVAPNSDAAPSG